MAKEKSGGETVFGNAGGAAHRILETMTENAEAFRLSSQAAVSGFRSLGESTLVKGKARFDERMELATKVRNVKSSTDVFPLQAEFGLKIVRDSFSDALEMQAELADFARAVFAPISAQYAKLLSVSPSANREG